MQTLCTDDIPVPPWPTPAYKVKKAFADGQAHAENHFNGEPADPDWPFGVKTWTVNPYNIQRPAVFYAWVAGFCDKWGELKRAEQDE